MPSTQTFDATAHPVPPPNPAVLPPDPQPIYNCPNCSHYIHPGQIACPECATLIYSAHLNRLAHQAQQLEVQALGEKSRLVEAIPVWNELFRWLPPGSQQAANIHTHINDMQARMATADRKRADWQRRLGPFAPILLLLGKLKSLLFILFKFKFLLSFLGYFGLYWALFGWQFALGFTVSILIHEMGHYVEVRRRGLKADLPVFLPGLGAYVRWYSMGIPLQSLATIALAGPTAGLLAAGGSLGLYFLTHQPVYMAIAHVGAVINLLNLTPVLGLDGAQATYALSRLQRGLLLASCIVIFAMTHQGVILLVAAGLVWRLFTRDEPTQPSTQTLVFFGALLFLLGSFLYIVPPNAAGMSPVW